VAAVVVLAPARPASRLALAAVLAKMGLAD
jgi:hypothetical protein